MKFKEKYPITQKLLTPNTKKRSGSFITPAVKFIVAHDTGNSSSTALNNVKYYERTNNESYPSAHIFVDDQNIIECIPALTGKPEKAWHVLYDIKGDNELYGHDANDVAIGVEYCFGGKINDDESYKRYVWVLAYICYKFNLEPEKCITGHFILDPKRKTDPVSGLKNSGRTFEGLLKDVMNEYNYCIENDVQSNILLNRESEKEKNEIPIKSNLSHNLIKKIITTIFKLISQLLVSKPVKKSDNKLIVNDKEIPINEEKVIQSESPVVNLERKSSIDNNGINFEIGKPNLANSQNTKILRKIINKEFGLDFEKDSLQCTEYVQYKVLIELGERINWAGRVGPRHGVNWPDQFIKLKRYKAVDMPQKGCAMSFAAGCPVPPGHVAYVEDVSANGLIRISEANWPPYGQKPQGHYNERPLTKEEWQNKYKAKFIDFT